MTGPVRRREPPPVAETITLLRRDHVSFALLLSALLRQAERAENGKPPSVELVKLILIYFRDYLRKIHHPKEEMVYNLLAACAPEQAAKCHHTIAEHRALADRLQPLELAVSTLNPHDRDSLSGFAAEARGFVEDEDRHITEEEGHLYPSAVHRLSAADWVRIDALTANDATPVFGEDAARPFNTLKDEILALEATLAHLQ